MIQCLIKSIYILLTVTVTHFIVTVTHFITCTMTIKRVLETGEVINFIDFLCLHTPGKKGTYINRQKI